VLAAGCGWLVEQERIGTDTEHLGDGDNPRGAGVSDPGFNAVHGVLTQADAPR
jgi:hypothetical protein